MRIALIIGAALLLIAAGAVTFALTADPNDHKGWIEAAASRALDRTIELRGPIELERSLTPRLVVQDLVVLEPGRAEPAIALARADLTLRLPALLRGQIHLPRVRVTGLNVRLPLEPGEPDADTDEPAADGEPFRLPRIDLVEIADVRIHHARDGRAIDLRIDDAVLKQGEQQTTIEIAGALADLPLAVSARLGSMEALFAGVADLPASLEASLDRAHLNTAGTFSLGPDGRGLRYDLDLTLDLPAMAPLLAALGVDGRAVDAANARARLSGDDRRIEATDLTLALDDAVLGGTLTADLADRAAVGGEIRAERLDLRRFLADGGAAAARPSPEPGEAADSPNPEGVEGRDAFLDRVLIRPGLVPLDLDLEVAIGRLDLPGQAVEDVRASVHADRQKIDLAIEAARFAGSPIALHLAVDADQTPPSSSATLTAGAVDLAATIGALDAGADLSGELAVEGQLEARGTTLRELLSSLSGGLSATGEMARPLGERTLTLAIERLTIDLPEAGGAAALGFAGRLDDLPVAVSGQVGTLAQLLDGPGELAVAIDVGLGETKLDLDGRIVPPHGESPFDYAFDLALDVPSPSRLADLAGAPMPDLPPASATARIRRAEHAAVIEDLALAVGASAIEGGLTLGFGGPRPAVAGALDARLIDLVELSSPGDGAAAVPAGPAAPGDRVIPAAPLPLPSSLPIDLDLAVTVGQLRTPALEIDGIEAKLEADGDTLRFELASAEVLAGLIDLDYRADETTSPPAIGVRVEVDDIDLDQLLDGSTLRGEIDLIVELDGHGTDLRRFLGGADGKVEVTSGALFVPGELADLAGRHVLTAILPTFEDEPGLEIHCSVIRLDVAGGKATTTDLVIDGEHLTIGGGGGVDLASEALDFLILPEGKGVRLGSLTAPVHVGGTLAAPRILPDAAELLFSTTETLAFGAVSPLTLVVPEVLPGARGRQACLTAADGPGKEPETVFGGIAGTAKAVGGAVRDAGESALDTVKGLFGSSPKQQ